MKTESHKATLDFDPQFPFVIVGVAKNNRALIKLNDSPTIFSVAGFNVCLNKGQWRERKKQIITLNN